MANLCELADWDCGGCCRVYLFFAFAWNLYHFRRFFKDLDPKMYRYTRLHLQGKVALQGFCAGEPQKCDVTDVISKVPTKRSKSWSPQDAHFLIQFYFHRNQIALSIYGDTSFSPSFLRSIGYFKAILHIPASKKWTKKSVTRRMDRRTSQFWGSLHKSPYGQ